MFKRISLDRCRVFTKTGYSLYENNKILITKQYSQNKQYFIELLNCFRMLRYGVMFVIGFPFMLIYTLFSFIPKIYIKDVSIDKKKELEKEETEREWIKRFREDI